MISQELTNELKKRRDDLYKFLDIKNKELIDLNYDKEISSPKFWDDSEKAEKVLKNKKQNKNWIEIYDRIIALGLGEGTEKFKLLKNTSDLTPRGGTVSTIVLSVLTSGMNPQMEFHFSEAFPISLTSLDFSSAATDVEYFTATV